MEKVTAFQRINNEGKGRLLKGYSNNLEPLCKKGGINLSNSLNFDEYRFNIKYIK